LSERFNRKIEFWTPDPHPFRKMDLSPFARFDCEVHIFRPAEIRTGRPDLHWNANYAEQTL